MTPNREWALAWANFDSFKNNLPEEVEDTHVNEYHQILDLMENSSGEDLSAFRIPDDKLEPKILSFQPPRYRGGGGSVRYSGKKTCDRNFMQRKLQALESYFNNIQPPAGKQGFGFTT